MPRTSQSERFLAAPTNSVQQRTTVSSGVTLEGFVMMVASFLPTEATMNSFTSSIISSLPTNASNCMLREHLLILKCYHSKSWCFQTELYN